MPTSTSPYSTTTRRRRFNANDPKYRCCCGGRCHVRTGAMFVGAAEIIIIGLFMIASAVWFVYDGYRRAHERRYGLYRARFHDQDPEEGYEDKDAPNFVTDRWSIIWLATCLASGVLFLITIALLFIGVVRERRCLLLPHMAAQALVLIAFAALLGYSAVMAILAAESLLSASDQQPGQVIVGEERRRSLAIHRLTINCLQAAACLLALFVFGAFFLVIYRYYGYLRDSASYEKKVRQTAGSSSPASTINGRQTIKLLHA